jgi:hypothetical protein
MSDLVQLAERLGCRGKPQALPGPKAACLARAAPAILAAVKAVGGAAALAAADPVAAGCLCSSLVQAVGDVRRSWLGDTLSAVERAFAVLGPQVVGEAVEDVRGGTPGFPHRACAASRPARAFMQPSGQDSWVYGHRQSQLLDPDTDASRQVGRPHQYRLGSSMYVALGRLGAVCCCFRLLAAVLPSS